jgi:DNA modification methylase
MMNYKIDDYVKGDAFDYMPNIPDQSVDLVFTSCPDLSQTEFDKSKDGIESYQDFQKKATEQFARIVKKDGFVVICQTDRRVNGSILSNHMWYAKCLEEQGMILKDYKIVVRNEVGKRDMYYFTFQHMLVYTYKGTITRKGDWLRDIYVDKQSKVLNQSVWSKDFCEYVISNLTEEGDMVVDPFAGVAPVLFTAEQMNRRYWGAESEENFYNESFRQFRTSLPF